MHRHGQYDFCKADFEWPNSNQSHRLPVLEARKLWPDVDQKLQNL